MPATATTSTPIETPRKSRTTSERLYSEGLVPERRYASSLLRDVPYVPVVNFDHLADAVLAKDWNDENLPPTVSEEMISQTLKVLEQNGTIHNGRWNDFDQNPSKSSCNEFVVFQRLEHLFEAIIQASSFANSNLLKLRVNGHNSPAPDVQNPIRTDGYMKLKESSIPSSEQAVQRKNSAEFKDNYHDIPVLCKFNKFYDDSSLYDDVVTILWGMHYCMRNDARRRFAYGLTIEDAWLRLWYTDRSAVIVSESIDWINNHRSFVKLILGFAAAREPVQLGYDTSIRRISTPPDDECYHGPVYEIDVHKGLNGKAETFVACRSIANHAANAMRGRGTRVWIVVKKEDFVSKKKDRAEYVLKDCWIDSDRKPEGSVLEELKHILLRPRDHPSLDLSSLRRHFLETVSHGEVRFSYQPVLTNPSEQKRTQYRRDRTFELHRGSKDLIPQNTMDTLSPTRYMQAKEAGYNSAGRSLIQLAANIPLPKRGSPPPVTPKALLRDMCHYRIVLSPVAESFTSLQTFGQIFTALLGAVNALKYLYLCGYVHRDVSIGNILLYENRGVLIDLEYAKHVDDQKVHESATGTRQFMSVEVTNQKFHFRHRQSVRRTNFRPPNWRHNILHDLDSVWWVSMWAVFSFTDPQAVPSVMDRQRFDSLFPVSNSSSSEREEVSQSLEGDEHAPSYNRRIWSILAIWRSELTLSFTYSQANYFEGGDAQPTADMCQDAFTSAINRITSILALDDSILKAPVAHTM